MQHLPNWSFAHLYIREDTCKLYNCQLYILHTYAFRAEMPLCRNSNGFFVRLQDDDNVLYCTLYCILCVQYMYVYV